jgi:hypothetical protein
MSASSLNKYRIGGRYSKVYDKLAYDIIFESATAQELAYGNTTGEKNPIFYATDINNDDIITSDESDTLKTDYYSDMDQNRLSLRNNFYYPMSNTKLLTLDKSRNGTLTLKLFKSFRSTKSNRIAYGSSDTI